MGTVEGSVEELGSLSVNAVFERLSSRVDGLATSEACSRFAEYGPNRLAVQEHTSLAVRLAGNFTHTMALLLWVAGALAFLARMPQLGAAIWAVNVLNGLFSFWQEYRADKATLALQRLLPRTATVIRQGHQQRVRAEDLVPGDVLLLSAGDLVPADARLISANRLQVNQSTLTGESVAIAKTADCLPGGSTSPAEYSNLVFAGTSVAAGVATALVFATGMNTAFGGITRLTQSLPDPPSPLQQELTHATKMITLVALGIGSMCFLTAIMAAKLTPVESFVLALGMIVAFVPEGLLPTVTLALAMGVQRMARRNALLKRLSAVETLGCTTVICTDKTGTLTKNEMTAVQLYVSGQWFTVTGEGYDPVGHILEAGCIIENGTNTDLREFVLAGCLCNDARLCPPSEMQLGWTVVGDPTDGALLTLALKAGIDPATEALKFSRSAEFPFDSGRRRMTTIHGSPATLYTKGAPDAVLELCTQMTLDGAEVPLNAQLRDSVLAANDQFARRGLRVIAVAKRLLCPDEPKHPIEALERSLTFCGFVGLMDPPRPEVTTAVARCRQAGIHIVMLTGDYGLTAETIARQVGILGAKPAAGLLTGTDLEAMSDSQLASALDGDVVVARSSPAHKLRVVRALQADGNVVAVTGDGVNDAPALRQADIGVAMGSGTDVAKEAADMILLGDNFSSIVDAVEEGRTVYANIRRFITYVLTSNVPEAIPFLLFGLSSGRIPPALNIMQILSVDLGTDIVPALALGAEPSDSNVMDQPPRKRNGRLITRALLVRACLWLGTLESLAAMGAFYFVYWRSGYSRQWIDLPAEGQVYTLASTVTLTCIVAAQIGNLFAQRAPVHAWNRMIVTRNPLIWIGILVEVLLILAITHLPALQRTFGTAPLPFYSLGLIIAAAGLIPLFTLVCGSIRAVATSRMTQAETRSGRTTTG